jgi:hypothetical protein
MGARGLEGESTISVEELTDFERAAHAIWTAPSRELEAGELTDIGRAGGGL